MPRFRIGTALCLAAALALSAPARAGEDAAALYEAHCAACHGADRLGGSGPALIPETLSGLGRAEVARILAEGRPATQMPGFRDILSDAETRRLADLLDEPSATPATFDHADIAASHRVLAEETDLVPAPVYDADPRHLFLVVETGDHHVSLVDGDRLETIHRFETRPALHGGPKFSPDGRFVYLASRDGWITKYDLYGLAPVAEIRVGLNTRNLAVSHDGAWVAVANMLPQTIVILRAADLAPRHVIPAAGVTGARRSRVSAVYQAAPRAGFIAALKDIPEIWEIPTASLADEDGPRIRRIDVPEPIDDFFFDQDYRFLVGAAREGGVRVIDLDSGAIRAELPIAGLPHLGSGITWRYKGRDVMATPNLGQGMLSIIDMERWTVIEEIETLGPGFFLRSHEGSRYAWVDVFFGPHADAVHVIDKDTLEIVKTLRPAPGKTAAHVEFTHDGRYALLSIWDMEGAVVVYDAETLEEVKRLPMRKPSGKYNVENKIARSPGTSH